MIVQPNCLKGRLVFGNVYGDKHLKDLLRSIERVWYCSPVPYFYLVLHGLRCRKSNTNGCTLNPKPSEQNYDLKSKKKKHLTMINCITISNGFIEQLRCLMVGHHSDYWLFSSVFSRIIMTMFKIEKILYVMENLIRQYELLEIKAEFVDEL